MEFPFIRDAGIRFDDGKIGIITLNVAEFNKSAEMLMRNAVLPSMMKCTKMGIGL